MKQFSCAFGRLHPAVGFFYFISVFVFCFLYQNPVILGSLLLSGLLYQSVMRGRRAAVRILLLSVPTAAFLLLINPLFNHSGATPLFYLNEKPFTLEAMLYGGIVALMVIDTILWFSIANDVLDKDKIIYLFGRPFPTASLLIGMIFRITAHFGREIHNIRSAQRGLGIQIERGPLRERLRNGTDLFLCLAGNALEQSVDTAIAMRARGYGLNRQSRRKPYRFHKRDTVTVAVACAIVAALSVLLMKGSFSLRILPTISPLALGPKEISAYLLFLLYFNLPLLYQGKEELRWRYLNSRMSASFMRGRSKTL